MPDTLWPMDDVFVAMVETDAVILTVSADRYDCLVDANNLFRMTGTGQIIPRDPETSGALIASGLFQRSPPAAPRKRCDPPLREAAIDLPASAADIVRSTIQLVMATLAFRRLSFDQLVAKGTPGPTPMPGVAKPTLQRLLAGYRAALPWVPGEGECLQRAFLLHRLLARNGVSADWVFGVRTWPFSAHCWIQIGDCVVGDTVGRVKAYRPIMVV